MMCFVLDAKIQLSGCGYAIVKIMLPKHGFRYYVPTDTAVLQGLIVLCLDRGGMQSLQDQPLEIRAIG
jgi:hypothetical protein